MTYAMANAAPSSPNASETAMPAKRLPPMAAEQHQSDEARLGPDGVERPGVLAPQPPEHRQDQQSSGGAGPRRIAVKQRGDLRDGEDEHEIEEELER